MGKYSPEYKTWRESFRGRFSQARNNARWLSHRGGIKKRRIHRMSARGLSPLLRKQLRSQVKGFPKYVKSGGKYNVRVTAQNQITSAPSGIGYQSFVGIGLDEHVATRLQTKRTNWTGFTDDQLKDISGARSRTSDLVWRTTTTSKNSYKSTKEFPPISGHTSGIKRSLVGGNKGAVTTGHYWRDQSREAAVNTTFNDSSSPNKGLDISVMSNLATIKYMSSPAKDLQRVSQDMSTLNNPLYSALTGTQDLRNGNAFNSLVDHVQESRERLKWETAAAMHKSKRLSQLIPPTMKSYLATHRNNPLTAMNKFRYDTHESWFAAPNINTSPKSNTEDLSKESLHKMTQRKTTTRPRALSDARMLPRVTPNNARGDK